MGRSPDPDDSQPSSETQQTEPWPATAERLRVLMTVILRRSHFLQRQIRSGQVWHATECMDALIEISDAVQQMESQLRQAEIERS